MACSNRWVDDMQQLVQVSAPSTTLFCGGKHTIGASNIVPIDHGYLCRMCNAQFMVINTGPEQNTTHTRDDF